MIIEILFILLITSFLINIFQREDKKGQRQIIQTYMERNRELLKEISNLSRDD